MFMSMRNWALSFTGENVIQHNLSGGKFDNSAFPVSLIEKIQTIWKSIRKK